MKRSRAGLKSGEENDLNIAVNSFISKRSKHDTNRTQSSPSINYNFLQNVFSTASFPEVFPATVVHSDPNTACDQAINALEFPGGIKTARELPDFLHYSSSEDDHDASERSRLRPPSISGVVPGAALFNQRQRERPQRCVPSRSLSPAPSYSGVKLPEVIRTSRSTNLTPSISLSSQPVNLRSENVAQAISPVPARLLSKAEILHLQHRTAATLSPPKVISASTHHPPGQPVKSSVAHLSEDNPDVNEKQNDPRKFACSSCSAKFSRRANLNRHQLVHTRDRPFKCHLCSQVFSLSGNLKRHVNNVHKTKL